jgi:hypothetical protein
LIILLAAAYGQNVMSGGTVRQWCRMFKDGQTNVHDEERSGQPSVVSDDLVQSVDQNICERQRFTISELSCEFPNISRPVLYEIITDRLGYHKCCVSSIGIGFVSMSNMVLKNIFIFQVLCSFRCETSRWKGSFKKGTAVYFNITE